MKVSSRVKAMSLAAIGLVLVSAVSAPQGREAEDPLIRRAREVERIAHVLINRERLKQGLVSLRWDERLAEAARGHSRRMAQAAFFSHDDPALGTLRARVERARIRWTMLAENIHMARNPRATAAQLARKAVEGWMNSPGHRANILNGRLTLSGIGAAFSRSGVLYLTHDFARP